MAVLSLKERSLEWLQYNDTVPTGTLFYAHDTHHLVRVDSNT